MRIILATPEKTILDEIADESQSIKSVTLTYAFIIRDHLGTDKIDFAKINKAIRLRWGMDTLIKIKEDAWKMVEEQQYERL